MMRDWKQQILFDSQFVMCDAHFFVKDKRMRGRDRIGLFLAQKIENCTVKNFYPVNFFLLASICGSQLTGGTGQGR